MTATLRSDLNDFLFTPIANEANGMHLTMLSALARTGVDPWEAAAGLRSLSSTEATQRLVQMLAGVPNGPAPGDDTATLAARLVEQLHSLPKSALGGNLSTGLPAGRERPMPIFSTLPRRARLTVYGLGAVILMIIGYQLLTGS